MKKLTDPDGFHIATTSENCIIEGGSWPDIPIMVRPGGVIDVDTSDYFRYQVINNNWKINTSRTNAEAIQHCMSYIHSIGCDFSMLRDTELRKWINAQHKADVKNNVIVQRVTTVYRYFQWAETNGRTSGAVNVDGRPPLAAPRISSKRVVLKHKRSRYEKVSYQAEVCPKRIPDELQDTPSHADVAALQVAATTSFSEAIGERNSLIIRWEAHGGMRRFECRALQVWQLPTREKAVLALARRESLEVKLVQTKNSRQRIISVLPDLIEDTWDYIENQRKAIVERFSAKHPDRAVPEEVLLSNKTGLALTDKAITNIFTALFSGAHVSGHEHRLRATHLYYLFEARLDAEEARMVSLGRSRSEVDYELVLRMVADQAGHKNIESLRPYLNLARKRRRNRKEVEEAVTLEQSIAYKKAELAVLEAQCAARREENAASETAAMK